MRRPPLIQFHVSPSLHRRLHRLRSERNINLSGWLRSLVVRELDRELGPGAAVEQKTSPAPLPGWSPYKLEDRSWGSCYLGDTRKLPVDLVGCSIQITTRQGETWIATVIEIIERRDDFVLVRDSGKPDSA